MSLLWGADYRYNARPPSQWIARLFECAGSLYRYRCKHAKSVCRSNTVLVPDILIYRQARVTCSNQVSGEALTCMSNASRHAKGFLFVRDPLRRSSSCSERGAVRRFGLCYVVCAESQRRHRYTTSRVITQQEFAPFLSIASSTPDDCRCC
jgi:hypothetical protein